MVFIIVALMLGLILYIKFPLFRAFIRVSGAIAFTIGFLWFGFSMLGVGMVFLIIFLAIFFAVFYPIAKRAKEKKESSLSR